MARGLLRRQAQGSRFDPLPFLEPPAVRGGSIQSCAPDCRRSDHADANLSSADLGKATLSGVSRALRWDFIRILLRSKA